MPVFLVATSGSPTQGRERGIEREGVGGGPSFLFFCTVGGVSGYLFEVDS